jgi:hypothetical protein
MKWVLAGESRENKTLWLKTLIVRFKYLVASCFDRLGRTAAKRDLVDKEPLNLVALLQPFLLSVNLM